MSAMHAPLGPDTHDNDTHAPAPARPEGEDAPGGAFVDVALRPRPPWDRPDQRAAHPALYDGLTLLPNGTLPLARLAMALTRPPRSGEPLALVLCEVDALDAFIDARGRDVADAALCTIAKRLEPSVRTADTVARGTGDEFVLLCERLTQSE